MESEVDGSSRKRILDRGGKGDQSPPSKFTRTDKDDEDDAFQDLISKIPRDMKLTRAQFEELLKMRREKKLIISPTTPSREPTVHHAPRSPSSNFKGIPH